MTSLNLADNSLGRYYGYLKDERVTDMTGIKAIADALSVSTSMTSIDLSSNQLCGLYLQHHTFGDVMGTYDGTGIKAIADALSVSSSMTLLNLAYNRLTFNARSYEFDDMSGVKAIADALSVSTSLNSLK